MAIRAFGVTNVALTVILGAVLAVACGDDDGTTPGDGDAGEGGGGTAGQNTGGGKAGSAGSSAGSDVGGKAGSGGTGGKAGGGGTGGSDQGGEGPIDGGAGGGEPTDGGAGGTAGTDAGGAGGAGGDNGSGPDPLPVISKLGEQVFTQASDLRGLFFTETGKLYASGHLGLNTVDRQIVVGRFDDNGQPDTTFGEDGFVHFNLVERTVNDEQAVTNDGNEESIGLVELETGEIVVQVNVRDANGKGMDVGLLKLDATGARVPGFGDNGLKKLVFGWDPADDALWPTANAAPSDSAWGIELDESTANQKIVVFGFGSAAKVPETIPPTVQRTDNDRYIVRVLASNGEIDAAFNGGNVFAYNSRGVFNDNGRRGIVESDGAIVAGGYTNFGDGLGNHVMLLRLKSDGTLDNSFGFGIVDRGVARTNPFVDDGGAAECYAVARQSDGRYVTLGYGAATAANTPSSYDEYATTTGPDLVSLAIKANGKGLDLDWGNLGTRVIQSEELNQASTEDRGRDLLALWDDRLVFVGRLGTKPAIFVTTPDGQYDPSNNVGQLFEYEPLSGTTSHFYRVVLSKDGTRVAAATNNHADGARLAILKVGDE